MDGWMDGWKDGRAGGWMGEWVDTSVGGWKSGRYPSLKSCEEEFKNTGIVLLLISLCG